MKLIVGLGNPGRQYASTRHNVGFMVVERLRRTHRPRHRATAFGRGPALRPRAGGRDVAPGGAWCQGATGCARGAPQPVWSRVLSLYAHGVIHMGGTTVRLMRPLTMMNRSGEALVSAVNRWRVAPAKLLLVCDDVNLPLGTLRLRPQGSDGGHHGLASCLDALGTQEIPRLRIGIGIQPLPKDLTDFVLSPLKQKERVMLDAVLARAAEACALWVTEGIQAAMNKANARTR